MKKNKLGTLNLILIILAALLVSFTIAMICVFCKYGSVPDSLIVAVFGAGTGEVSICGWIRTAKNKVKGLNDGEMD